MSPRPGGKRGQGCGRAKPPEACMASSITQAREGSLYLMCGGEKSAFEKAAYLSSKRFARRQYSLHRQSRRTPRKVKALVNMVMNINTAGLAEGLELGAALGLDLTMLREVFLTNRRRFARASDRRRRHAESRAQRLFLRRARRQGQWYRPRSRTENRARSALARATRSKCERMISEGLGELDKSGIAELTFKDRHKHTGDHI